MVTQITPEHLNEYIQQYSDETVTSIKNDDFLFEALSEKIAEKNPEMDVGRLAAEYNEQDEILTIEEFVTQKFREVVHEDTLDVISYAQRNKWIEYTRRGMIENGAELDN